MKLLLFPKAVKVLFLANILLLPAHIAVETRSHDVNWLRLGHRSSLAANCIRLEGVLTIFLILAIFELFYPDMGKMFRSKEIKRYGTLICVQVAVWFFYR